MGARLLLIPLRESAAYQIKGTIYLFKCCDLLEINDLLDWLSQNILMHSSKTFAALFSRDAVVKRCFVASNMVSVFVWIGQVDVALLLPLPNMIDCNSSNPLSTFPRWLRPYTSCRIMLLFLSRYLLLILCIVDCFPAWKVVSQSGWLVHDSPPTCCSVVVVFLNGAVFEFLSRGKKQFKY